ncbi:hypothetical protein [Leifsonia sp. Leaf264]|uniref:hypothetical protein n=1 Tax=Leifsonia sp. Leaf264 TaxID=1736314 RepID=UPI0007007B26|nr:hypothetical protein [Leifsonia sp. Leaf264]KQP01150.1 hypothetical protein ASF30_00450 [Leifsonia sp. Leaf264]
MPKPSTITQHSTRTARIEHRWPAVFALVVALALYGALPNDLITVQRYVTVAIGILLLIPLIAINPHHLTRQTRWSRTLSLALAIVVVLSNQITIVSLVLLLVGGSEEGPSLLQSALQVWVANVIGFALLYWEIDRGGPVVRTMVKRSDLPRADFRFPQDEDDDTIDEVAAGSSGKSDWTASYVDYFYFSLSNSMAFSPTDTMPLTARSKLLMSLESFGGFVILALVIARAVSLIG